MKFVQEFLFSEWVRETKKRKEIRNQLCPSLCTAEISVQKKDNQIKLDDFRIWVIWHVNCQLNSIIVLFWFIFWQAVNEGWSCKTFSFWWSKDIIFSIHSRSNSMAALWNSSRASGVIHSSPLLLLMDKSEGSQTSQVNSSIGGSKLNSSKIQLLPALLCQIGPMGS